MRSLGGMRKQGRGYDPAPSRLGYRIQRLLLTPGVVPALRIGTPVLLVALVAGGWFAQADNRAALSARIAGFTEQFQSMPQFMVTGMTVTGADDAVAADIAIAIDQTFPVSTFDLDLEDTRRKVEALPSVAAAKLVVGPEGRLVVAVTPRVPVAVWRDNEVLRLIDAAGHVSGTLTVRSERSDLPLIAGDGAEQHIAEALALFNRAGPLQPRVRGLVRMGERRWDIVLDRDQRIMLPSEGAVAAFDRIIVLDQADNMLERDVAVVDMRHASRPTLRMSEEAALALRRGNEIQINNGADQ